MSYNTQEQAFVKLLNDYRVANGLQPLLVSDALSLASERHASDMGKYDFFSHVTKRSDWFPAGSYPWDRMKLCGYYSGKEGENLAAGQSSAQSLFTAWRASSSHNSVMLDPGFKVVGVGFVITTGSDYTYYWDACFGGTVDGGAHTLGPVRYQQTNRYILKYGTWCDTASSLASGGSYGWSSTRGAAATVAFIGTRLDWLAAVGPSGARVDIYLDGVKKTTLDLYAATAAYGVRVWSTGSLPYGTHTVRMVRNSDCPTGEIVTLDAVDLWGTLKPAY